MNPREEDVVFLVVRLPRAQMVKARNLLHAQDWYSGSDTPIRESRDYWGISTADLFSRLERYFGQVKIIARRRKATINKEESRG